MNERPPAPAAPRRLANHPLWLFVLLALLAWQGWMALGLFGGGERPWERLLDDDPVLSGRHPLHLYHGSLGARALRERGSLSCFDPAFFAGYPKTPVFDSGSRPAELVLALAGPGREASAYKIGLAALCALAPLLLYTAARGVGLGRAAACLGCALGLGVWWGRPCQADLVEGNLDLLWGALLVLAQAGLLIRYHKSPGLLSLFGVVLTGFLAWFAHPILSALLLPLFLIYYLSVGARHPLSWHLPLKGGLLLALAANAFWLIDWARYWWVLVPLRLQGPLLAHRTFRTFWEAPLWGGPMDRAFAAVLILAATAGVVLFNQRSQRVVARLLGLAWFGFLALALLGIAWEPLGQFGAAQLLVPALLFCALPAAHALSFACGRLMRWSGSALVPGAIVAAALGVAWLVDADGVKDWAGRLQRPEALEVGLGPERSALVSALRDETSNDARILLEDRDEGRWTALLPLLTGRAFVGGLGPDAPIEHASAALADQSLAGRPLREWDDDDLDEYCRRYNIGWVACWSPAVRARFRRWAGAEPVPGVELGDGELFRLRRRPSYALTGSVSWRSADARCILLADASPARVGDEEEGQVLLSLHYQAGMRVTPSRVRLEPAPWVKGPIPFVRLRLSEPVGRVMITWDGR
jgi:hypothetical protein